MCKRFTFNQEPKKQQGSKMSRTKKSFKWYDEEDDYENERRKNKRHEDRRKMKKIKNALKTRNIDELIGYEE